jgi:glycosyltransferase involved in cell wall biosynthesis
MTFSVITHVQHKKHKGRIYAYGPYVREMNIWFKFVDKVNVVGPLIDAEPSPIDIAYEHDNLSISRVPEFSLISIYQIIRFVVIIPYVFSVILSSFFRATHLHLRCPGNMGLLACFAQVFFPSKVKTAKYAGNWDPKSNQPFSYKLQKYLLSNTFLTRNIKVLVYGEWPNQSKNIISFYTASYFEKDRIPIKRSGIKNRRIELLFVGGWTKGKQPDVSLTIFHKLLKKRHDVSITFLGDGILRKFLETYVIENELTDRVAIKGNVDASEVRKAYLNSDFLVFLSKSEGWPKAVAEAMFLGCIPVTLPVSCLPFMLDGNRGLLVEDKEDAIRQIDKLINSEQKLDMIRQEGVLWSRKYTIDRFERDIKNLILAE